MSLERNVKRFIIDSEQFSDLDDGVFRRPWLGLALGVVLPIPGLVQARRLPEQFFPPADRDQIQVEVELASRASLPETLATAEQVRVRISH